MKYVLIIILLSVTAIADDFQPIKSRPEKITCTFNKDSISFSGLKQTYAIYDKNSASIRLINCEKIQIKDQIFYTALFTSEVFEGSDLQKVLTYEVALLNKKTAMPETVRSETVDQIDMSGDTSDTNFHSTLKTEWGQSKKDNVAMLKIEMIPDKEKPFAYFLKYNGKSAWFENQFEKIPEKKDKKTK